MVSEKNIKSSGLASKPDQHKYKLSIFHCFNALNNTAFLTEDDYQVKGIKLPCSSMIRELVLLRAFEAGADAVIVLGCPKGTCRFVQGNLRAEKRVTRVKQMLDDIGIDGKRLNFFNIKHGDATSVEKIVKDTIYGLAALGPNPAA
jgi:coenzyme F420-reducing hydrogenase delta subunit